MKICCIGIKYSNKYMKYEINRYFKQYPSIEKVIIDQYIQGSIFI